MIVKSIVMLCLFFIPLILVNVGLIQTPLLLFAMYVLSGIGMAGIGMGVMHDAIHGSYSKKRLVNKYMGYTMNLIGANDTVWKIQHNVLHHTYTNIEEADEDINAPFFLRFSPHAKRNWLHRFQHLYIWFFYGFTTLLWVTSKDFVHLTKYRKLGFIKTNKMYLKELFKLTGWKLFYYSYALIIPIIMVSLSPWLIILAFVTMHFLTGLAVSLVFQSAHVMPDTDFPLPDENGLIANDWTIHQLVTTSNFSPRSRIFSWFIGGLNFQVEHHLLPNICHVHYKKISKIVAETAREYGIPYLSKKTFIDAIVDHYKMMRMLGKLELSPATQRSNTK